MYFRSYGHFFGPLHSVYETSLEEMVVLVSVDLLAIRWHAAPVAAPPHVKCHDQFRFRYYESAKAVLGNTEDGFYWCANYSDKFLGKNYTDVDLDKKGHVVYFIIGQVRHPVLYAVGI